MKPPPSSIRGLAALALLAALAIPAAARDAQVLEINGAEVQIRAGAGVVVNQAEVRMGPVARRKIFVPEPKGADETLDDSADRKKAGQGDTVTTTSGDRVVGKVIAIEADGRLRLTAPQFEGEIVVKADALETIDLLPKEKSDGPDRAALSNDDVLVGDVVGITPTHVIIESKATGPVRISRKIVRHLSFSQTNPTVLESRFAKGDLKPWQKRGSWTVTNGAAQSMSHGRQSLYAKFDQDEAVTMEVKVQAMMHRYLNCELVLFSDTSDQPYGRNSVSARFYSTNIYVMYTQDGRNRNVMNRSMGRLMQQATLRLAYDPESSKVRVWLNSGDIGTYVIPHKLTKGKYVMFNSSYPCRVTSIRVVSGIAGPGFDEKTKDETKTHVVRFANRDRVAAADLAMTDGTLNLKTEFGDIATKVERVSSIAFRTQGIEKPRRRKRDVRVHTANSRLTLEFDHLTPEHLVGKSSYLGEITISRACLKKIQFNLYK
jgi:hypothetical protein